MRDSFRNKLLQVVRRHDELSGLLSDPDVIKDQNKFRDLSKEFSDIEDIVLCFKAYLQSEQSAAQAEEMLKDSDPDMRAMAEDELAEHKAKLQEFEQQLEVLLLPKDPDDHKNVFLEIRAGTGGDEAAIFAGDLFRMYNRFAEIHGWSVEIINANEADHGGYKEVIAKLAGKDVYGQLKFESGAHRVQRVPATESQGRIHTSACTVAILPEVEEIESVDIDPSEIRVDTFRAQGAGGQHVNTTDSAVRLTHIPTGIVAECQDERSQHKNRAKAMSLLQSKILNIQRQQQRQEQEQTRRNLVGSGDRSERIRTYNFPQGRMTDHRINLTLYKLDQIMEGDLAELIAALIREHQADMLAAVDKE